MRTLKIYGIALVATLVLIGLVACGGSDDDPIEPTPTPTMAKIEIAATEDTKPVFGTEGGAATIKFTATQAWTATAANDRASEWLSISPSSGTAGSSSLTITTKENDTYDERSASIIIKSGTAQQTIVVTQKQKDALLVSSGKIEVSAEGEEVQIEVKANVDFSVETDVDWVRHTSTRALKTSNLIFTVAENEKTDKREGHISIKSGMLLETVTIYQTGDAPAIIISQNEYAIGSDGGDIKVEVSSNVDVSVTLPKGGWISESTTRSMSTHTYVFTVSKNEGYDSRSGEILFTNNENNLSEKVVITQMQRDAIIVARSKYEMDAEGGTLSFEVQTNVDFEVSVDADWLTKADTRALRAEKIKFNVESNNTYDDRNATITIKSAEVTQKVSVVQHGLAAVAGIELSYSSLELNAGESYQLTATVFPTDASNKEVEWSSSDESIAIVDDEGNVTGVAEGKAYITVTTIDGNWSDTCTVIVTEEDGEDDDSGIATLSDPLTLEAIESGTITIKNTNRLLIGYVKNNGAKETSSLSNIVIPINAGDKVCFYGDNAYYSEFYYDVNNFNVGGYTNIKISNKCYIYGNIMSLIKSEGFESLTDLGHEWTFASLFYDNKYIKNHPSKALLLPATTLTPYCYRDMFLGCTSLTEAPELPATTLADYCYFNMFGDCTSLMTTPELPATTLAEDCYDSMFYGCTSLTKAPALPASFLANSCYRYMFGNCTSLVVAPELPATTLADYCYFAMFSGCTSLTEAPELPATTLADECYGNMFYGTGLTEAPKLPATTLVNFCYSNMFGDCIYLTVPPVLQATTLAPYCYYLMFNGCASLTTAPQLPTTTLAEGCYKWMFWDCTSLTEAPELPATTLAEGCYVRMFDGCTGLKEAPVLPAGTLAEGCYAQMFQGCKSLNRIICLAVSPDLKTDENGRSNTFHWLKGVSPSGIFIKAAGADWEAGDSGIPLGWEVKNYSE